MLRRNPLKSLEPVHKNKLIIKEDLSNEIITLEEALEKETNPVIRAKLEADLNIKKIKLGKLSGGK